jgi:hypothetical protein
VARESKSSRIFLRLLSRYSTPGHFIVAVTQDESGSNPVAKSIGPTISDGSRELVTVTLDLRSRSVLDPRRGKFNKHRP